jgi:hypothetical protein
MTDEEIKLRCIEMAYNRGLRHFMSEGYSIFEQVYPYLKEGKIPKEDNS